MGRGNCAGKTKCINHFLINDSWYLVDLPGYGYAKSSKDMRIAWNEFTKLYFLERETLALVMLLIDASIPPQLIDVACAAWLHKADVPFMVVFTKADKRKKRGPDSDTNVAAFLEELEAELGGVPEAFVTSATEGRGGTDVLHHLAKLRQSCEAQPASDGGAYNGT
jgi:GTP-binding protein